MSNPSADTARVTSRVRLAGNEVHLEWGRRDAVESLDVLTGWLSEDERRRSERFRREPDAQGFVFRRAFLRATLAARLGCAPGELAFASGEFGKPRLVRPATDLCFNASSSGAWVVVALASGRELGVDLERLAALPEEAEELSRLAARVASTGERAAFERLEPGLRARAFLDLWARKEALLKALGTGLSREPSTVEVGLEPRRGARGESAREGVRLCDLEAPPGCAASVAVVTGA